MTAINNNPAVTANQMQDAMDAEKTSSAKIVSCRVAAVAVGVFLTAVSLACLSTAITFGALPLIAPAIVCAIGAVACFSAAANGGCHASVSHSGHSFVFYKPWTWSYTPIFRPRPHVGAVVNGRQLPGTGARSPSRRTGPSSSVRTGFGGSSVRVGGTSSRMGGGISAHVRVGGARR